MKFLIAFRFNLSMFRRFSGISLANFTAFVIPFLSLQAHAIESRIYAEDYRHNVNFFENSVRRDPNPTEEKILVRAATKANTSACTGFFIANSKNKILLGTARHCYQYSITEACNTDSIRIFPTGAMTGKFVGTCKRVAVANSMDDFAIIELNIQAPDETPASAVLMSEFRSFYSLLRLANYSSPAFMPLKMFGYPSDQERGGKATVSEECWILPDTAKSAISAIPYEERDPRYKEWAREYKETPENIANRSQLKMRIRKFNCSVYSGNSGGPIVIKNTLDLIGLPQTYYPGLYNKVPEDFAHDYEEIKQFIAHNRDAIQENGILLSHNVTHVSGDYSYLKRFSKTAVYHAESGDCGIKVVTDVTKGFILTTYVNNQNGICERTNVPIRWDCAAVPKNYCINANEEHYWDIDHITPEGFRLKSSGGAVENYTATQQL